jgi:hypothetical protein
MELYKIAAIAKKIYEELRSIETETCRKEWQYSIYYTIIKSVNNVNCDLFWEENYSQWNINHLFRSQENALKRNPRKMIISIESLKKTSSGIIIKGYIKKEPQIAEDFEFKLNEQDFVPLEIVHDNGRRILFDAERFAIIDSILELEEVVETKGNQKSSILPDKVKSLVNLLGAVRDVYSSQDETGKNFIETVIGASIFYLPHPVNECFNGYCSIKALNEKIKNKRIVREHITPRKYAAREILDAGYMLNNFPSDFSERFRRFMYLTSEENKKTVNYTEKTHDEALLNLDVVKFPNTKSPFVNNHTLFMNFISFCKENKKKNKKLNIESAMLLLEEFCKINHC